MTDERETTETGDSTEQGGEFQGNSLLTQPDGASKDTPPGTAASRAAEQGGNDASRRSDAESRTGRAGEAKFTDTVPDKPEGYGLKFAESTQIDKDLLDNFQNEAHALGLKPSQAQKLAYLYEAHAAKAGERIQTEQRQALETAKAGWEDEIQKRPGFLQEREHGRATLRKFGSSELNALLDQTGLGSHPHMWNFMAKVGKALTEPGFKGESMAGGPKTAAEILYPDQGKEG
jgi:hypothetical protein